MKLVALCLLALASGVALAQAVPQAARTSPASTAEAMIVRSVPPPARPPMNNAELSKLLRAQTMALQSLSAKIDALSDDVANNNAKAKARLDALTLELASIEAKVKK